ncbi:MAG: hypothetical protein LBM73_01525 [Candidatus Nomurabacteria bacterium]|jgi:hypothetical protein|nr:hypothetical protein [Candidatus Nomurabacteria bacterium]
MYSGTTLTRASGRIAGTHQKIDRVARRKLQPYLSAKWFPTSREILHFEGRNGPDGVKIKSPASDEPWHYINPNDPADTQLLGLIADGQANLIKALKENNRERAAFEAAWLSHALTDGLTPAHHSDYKTRRDDLLGDDVDKQEAVGKKILKSGDTLGERLKNIWEFYKPNGRGVGSAHLNFELGVAFTITPLRFGEVRLTTAERAGIRRDGGIVKSFRSLALYVDKWKMFEDYLTNGWTARLARTAKNELLPLIIHTVLLEWYYCLWAAEGRARNSLKNNSVKIKAGDGQSPGEFSAAKNSKVKNGQSSAD